MGRLDAQSFQLIDLARPPAFIPETVSAREALKQMQSSRVHFVFVVNEHGGVEGILSLEDLLEEIVGEIDDEFDEETKSQIKRDRESFVLDGMLAVRAANQQLGLALPEWYVSGGESRGEADSSSSVSTSREAELQGARACPAVERSRLQFILRLRTYCRGGPPWPPLRGTLRIQDATASDSANTMSPTKGWSRRAAPTVRAAGS